MAPPKHITYFNPDWLLDKRFSYWLQPAPKDNTLAACRLCSSGGQLKTFSLSSMGIKALESHASGSKHKIRAESYLNARENPIEGFLVQPPTQQSNAASSKTPSRGKFEFRDLLFVYFTG